jgi:hypothetical protein
MTNKNLKDEKHRKLQAEQQKLIDQLMSMPLGSMIKQKKNVADAIKARLVEIAIELQRSRT